MILTEYGKKKIPLKLTWEVTEKCNLNCLMCYSIDCNSKKKIEKELSTKDIEKMFNILEKNNVLYLFLEGGEPMLKKDFFKILNLSTSKFCTWLSTNGTLIGNSEAKEFKKSLINTIFVSLHGSSGKIHDSITQTSNSFNRTISGIESLVREKVSVMTSYQVSKLNMNDIEDYIKLCKDLKVPKINFLRPYPLGNGKENYNKYSLSKEEFKIITKEIENKCKKYNIKFGHSFGENNHNCCKQAIN